MRREHQSSQLKGHFPYIDTHLHRQFIGGSRLSTDCAVEIVRGAADESEMGVFHDLFTPQRLANLTARLEEFIPSHNDVAVLIAN